MALIIFCIAIWGVCKAISYGAQRAKERKRREEMEQIRRAQEQQREAIRLENARRKEIEAEQKRIAKEQMEQAIELAKHEEHLLRHDSEIEKLTFKMNQAEEDIEYLRDKIKRLVKLAEFEELERDSSVYGGKEFQKHEKKLIAYENQIRTANRQLEKAVNVRNEAQRKTKGVA